MSNQKNYVFLMDCADFSEAQVIRSFLMAQGLHPRVKDEQTRGVAPHFGQLLGKLTLEIPEHEYMEASQLLESREQPRIQIVTVQQDVDTEALAKKALWNAILGCVFVPLLCNFYSMALGYRVLRQERPLGRVSRNRLLLAILFNSIAFYGWLYFGPKLFPIHF
ncbi:hypothetical protein [Bdellovibrio sp.]|uniref:hypothetical protein n=1 Tax=Bdellovibrio TaxID=958 RepID=UPI003221C14D